MKRLIYRFLLFFSLGVFAGLLLTTIGCKNKETGEAQLKNKKGILFDKQGNPIPLPKDKLIVVNFFAYSCSSCMREMPTLKKIIQEPKYKDKFVLIGLALDATKNDLSDPVFPKYANHNRNFLFFQVPGTPTTYIITPKGKKLVIIYGAVTEKSFRKFLDEALEKYKKLQSQGA